jgi:hypothetical protein
MNTENENRIGRKRKAKLDFFYLDADWKRDAKIRKLRHNFGAKGVLAYISILTDIYANKGYYLEWDESTVLDVAEFMSVKSTTVSGIVEYCCAIGLFDKDLCTRDKVLSSKSIQARWSVAMRKARRKCEYPEEYSLFETQEDFFRHLEKYDKESYDTDAGAKQNGVSSEEIAINAEETRINVEEIETRKEKKRKDTIKTINSFSLSLTCELSVDLKNIFDGFEEDWKPPMAAWINYKQKSAEKIKEPARLKANYTKLRDYSGENLKVARWIIAYAIVSEWKGFRIKSQSNYWVDYDQTDPEEITPVEKNQKPINIPFSDFWDLYDKKRSAEKCEKKWSKLSDADREAIMAYLPEYISSTPVKDYRKDPMTFLNNKSWKDEILKPKGGTHGKQSENSEKSSPQQSDQSPSKNYSERF